PRSWRRRRPMPFSCTVCRPTAASKWPPRCSTARRASSGTRPRTGCTPRRRCSSSCCRPPASPAPARLDPPAAARRPTTINESSSPRGPPLAVHAKPLRLLLLDPSADDAELTLASLRAGGRRLKAERVADARALRRALGEPWDAVVSEHIPPQIDALAVLDALAAAGQDVPLVVLARALP